MTCVRGLGRGGAGVEGPGVLEGDCQTIESNGMAAQNNKLQVSYNNTVFCIYMHDDRESRLKNRPL